MPRRLCTWSKGKLHVHRPIRSLAKCADLVSNTMHTCRSAFDHSTGLKSTHSLSCYCQAKCHGPRGRRPHWINAEWLRLGTRRVVQPADPTAECRDAIGPISIYSTGVSTEPRPELGTNSTYRAFRPTMTASIDLLSRRLADKQFHSDLSRPEGWG